MEVKAPWLYRNRMCLLLIIGTAARAQPSQYARQDCCYGKSSFKHGQTVSSIPACCVYLSCYDGDIRKHHLGKPGSTSCCEFAGLLYPDGGELEAQCVTLTCRQGEWTVSQDIVGCCKHCYLFNDPHVATFDGHYYDWHGACNYSVTQTGTSLYPEIGVFSDFHRCYHSASCLHVSTFKNDEHTVITLHHDDPFTIEVNGNQFVVPTTGVVPVGSHPVLAWRDDTCIYLLGSSQIMLQHCRHRLDVWAHPTHVNSLYGLCGHFSFQKEDDFTSRSLTVHPLHTRPMAFPESWRTSDQGYACRSCYNCDKETIEDPCRLDDVQQQGLKALCSRRLHSILASDVELGHYVDACQFDLCQLRQARTSKEKEEEWLQVLEALAEIAKVILARTSGEWEPAPDMVPSHDLCVPGSRWKNECNWCGCTGNGTSSFCTLIACPAGYIHPLDENSCADGSRWRTGCNWCSCVRGGFQCSRKPCASATQSVSPESIIGQGNTATPPQCLLSKDMGPCFGFFERYAFNAATDQCEVFVFGGCEGNGNNFESQYECEKTCK